MSIDHIFETKAGRHVIAAAMAVAAGSAGFSHIAAPREAIAAFVVLFFASAAVMAAVVWHHRQALWSLPWKRALILVVLVAALFRLAALVAPVSLSDDIWRYLWDGQVVAAGDSPYAESATERMERVGGDDELFDKINRPDNQTVYPPLAQVVFAASVQLESMVGGAAERWLRVLFSLFDLLGVIALGLVLVRLGRSVMWAVLYAWHPIVYWEVAAGGHTEALGVVFLAALVGFGLSKRAVACGIAIGLAGLAKWTFLVVSPVVALYLLRARGWMAAISATVAALVVFIGAHLPFRAAAMIENQWESARLYAEHFSFNAPLYYTLRFVAGYEEGITEPVHHITGPLLTGGLLLAVAVAALWQNGEPRRLIAGVALAAGAYVVFSPVFHPWYALPFFAAGALAGWTTPAVVGLVIVVSYFFYAPGMTRGGEVMLMAGQTVVVGAWMAWEFGPRWLEWVLRRRAARKANVVSETLDGDESILDMGCAEGYVGQALAGEGHDVELVDVVDLNRTELPMTVYDGHTLPFEDDSFDVVVVSYVLHHAEDPDAVLAEALRVGRQVVILETVFEKDWDRRLVTFLDHGANALRGLKPEPLQFDTVDGWIERINACGGEVQDWRWLGRGVHRHVVIRSSTGGAPGAS